MLFIILNWVRFFFHFGCGLLSAASAFCKDADNIETIELKRFHSIILWFGSAQTRENHLYLNVSLDKFFYYWNSGFNRGQDYSDFAKGFNICLSQMEKMDDLHLKAV